MLQVDLGTIYRSEERRLKAGTNGVVEGQALVADYENGELVVRPATAANERFVGVAISSVNAIKSLTKVEVLTTAAAISPTNTIDTKQVTLAHKPTALTIRIDAGSSNIGTRVTDAPTLTNITAGKYHLDDNTNVLTLPSNATEYRIQYRYSPTVLEAINIQGEPEPGTHVSDVTETIGVITAGEVFTSEWLTTVAWSGTSKLILADKGKFTTHATNEISNTMITKVPDTETGLLGFRFIT